MNPIEKLKERLAKDFPEVDAEIDAPDDPNGNWCLDVFNHWRHTMIVVEWRPGKGFGVSDDPDLQDSFSNPDEVFPDAERAYAQILSLLTASR